MRLSSVLAVFALGMAGCGYRFTAGGAPLPGGVRAAHVPVFSNQTGEPGLEVAFTQALREQLVRAGTAAQGASDAQVRGAVLAVSSVPKLATVAGLLSYRLTATAQLSLVRGEKTLLTAQVVGVEDYLAGVDPLRSEANRQEALRRLAERMMRDGYEQLASGE